MESLQSQLKEQSRRLEQLEEISRREEEEDYVSDHGEWIDCVGCASPIKPGWPRCPGCKLETKKTIERLAKKKRDSYSSNGHNGGDDSIRKSLQEELSKTFPASSLSTNAGESKDAQPNGLQKSLPDAQKSKAEAFEPPINGNGDKSDLHHVNGGNHAWTSDHCEFGTQTDTVIAHIWPDTFEDPVKKQLEEPKDDTTFNRIEDTTPVACRFLFGGFSHQSLVRKKCFEVHKSPFWGSFFVLVTIANAAVIAVRPSLSPDFNTDASGASKVSTPLSEAFDFFCVAVLFCEVLSGCIAFGFHAWIHSDYHKLDFAALLVVALEYGASAYGENALILRCCLLRVRGEEADGVCLQAISNPEDFPTASEARDVRQACRDPAVSARGSRRVGHSVSPPPLLPYRVLYPRHGRAVQVIPQEVRHASLSRVRLCVGLLHGLGELVLMLIEPAELQHGGRRRRRRDCGLSLPDHL